MEHRDCGSHTGNRVVKSIIVEGNLVHISFNEDDGILLSDGIFSKMKAIEEFVLLKKERLGRIHIFGLLIVSYCS